MAAMERLACILFFALISQLNASPSAFCADDCPSIGELEGQLDSLQDAMKSFLSRDERCHCGCRDCGCEGITPSTDPPTTPPPDECELTGEIYDVVSAFPEVEYDDDFTDPESSLFLETEKELIECLEEVLDELLGKICIDVTSIREADPGTGIEVDFKLTSDGSQTHDEINEVIANNTKAPLCSNFKYVAFYSFQVRYSNATWAVVSDTRPEHYRVTVPLCEPWNDEFNDPESPRYTDKARTIVNGITRAFAGVPGTQAARVEEFWSVGTAPDISALALVVVESRAFYELAVIQTILKNMVSGIGVSSCSELEDFTITYWPIPRHQLRLTEGNVPSNGRAEIFRNDEWRSICSTKWRVSEWPTLFCGEYGYPGAIGAAQVVDVNITSGTAGPAIKNTRCSPANKRSIFKCQRSADLPNCNHAADMAVNCQKLVRLAGGPRVIEGRVEFFNGNKWGTVCSNSITPPNNDFAEVLCSELGYSGVDTVEWARDYNEIGVGKGNITFMNPKCNLDTTKSMQDCGLRPDLEDCNHSNDVYVKCTGPVTNVPRLLDAPIYGAITCRSEMVAWADGSHLVTRRSHYRTAALIEMPTDTQVLAVKCSKTSIGGLLATLSNGFRSDRNWMCTTRNVSEENWKQAGYDDSNWETPAEVADLGESPYGNVKGIDDPKAKWLWVHWREAYRIDMYCRLWFNRETTVYFANGPLPSIGVMGFLETQRGVHDYKFYSPNWPSVACRESGYQWAQGSEYSSVAEISSLSNSPSLRRPDFCPGIEDGYMSECIPFNEYDQNSYDVAINCRPRVELIGGNAREGILRIYKRYEWGTVCDYDPTTARYKRVCLELGYPEIESVRVEDGSGIDAEEQVAMHNIQCINDTVSIMDCTSDPLFNVCGHDKDVYIECRGGQEGVHESLVPTSVKASCGSHSKVDVYTDGLLIRSTSEHAYTDMAKDTEVIGVHCVWDDDDDDDDDTSKDLTVELGNGIVSNDRWQCSNKRWDHWSSMHFNPRSYSAARELQKDSVFPFPIHAKRIRAADNEDSNELFCRRQLADYFRVTLVFTDHEYTSALSNSSTRAYQMMEELYIPKLTTLFTSTFGTQTVQIEGFDIGLDNEITRRRKRSTIGLMVKWIIRSVNYDNEGELYKVVKDAIDSGNIDGLTPQLEHFTFVRLDMTYMLLRLVDGPQDHIGRVEVYKHGIWGSVCDHEEWVTDFGELFCHTRKYPRTNSHYVTGLTQAVNANIPIGTTPHTIINPHGCKSYSQSPYECIRHPIGEPDHDNDLAINCRRKVRLGFSEKKREGKLEMYDGENWGSVCVHSLENVDFGDVACKELGYPEGAKAVLYAKNEMGRRAADSDHLALQNPACDPMTTRAMETCGSNRDELSCDQQKNVFLKCKGQPESTPRDLRFPIQGQVTCDSIVEVWADGKLFLRRESWKLIHYVEIPAYTRTLAIKCISKSYQGGIIAHFGSRVQSDDTWNCFTENLAEGEEGLKGEDFSDSNYDASSWIKSHKLGVSGDSERWAGYPLEFVDEYPEIEWMWGKEKQGHTTVICRKNFVIKADVRLQDGIHPYHGRVEVNKHGTWGSVCETELQTGGWPSLVCIELGFPGIKSAAYANNETGIQQGVGDIAIKSPNCDQFTANSLGQCLGTPDQLCLHDLDVVIECHPKIRLVDGPTDKEGLVQVFIDGEWGYITDRRKPLFDNYPWVHLACKDAGFGRASAAISVQDMRRSGTPRAPMNAHNPTCSDDATSFDDCPNDPNLYSNPLSKVIYLTCTPPPGGSGGGVGFPFTPGKVSCRGTLKVYADGAIMFNSELSGPFDLVHFTLPTDFKKLSVQCIPIDSHLDINFSLDSKPEGQWRCLHAEVPEPIWTHLNFDQSSWPHANVTDVNATAFILAPTEKRDPFLPVSCSIIVNDEPVPPFNITSPAGCDSLTKYLPDMWSKCKYRECVYGRSPWVTLDGELSVMVRRTPCPANMTVPDTFEPGDTMPCTVPGKLCAECPSYPLYHRHPDSRCQYLKCESTPYVDPEGRTRYVAKEYTCPSTKGIPKNFIEGIITPCSKYRDECAPDDPEPEPTQGDCTDSETNGVIHETEWLSGCAVITSQEYDPNMDNQGSDIFQTTASDVIGALENTLCNVPANIDIRILDIIEFEGVGINVKWHMQVTMTPGMDIAQIHQEIQEAVANGEIIHYRPDSTYVRFAVMGGGCNITLETVNYILTTNIDLPFLPEYLTQTPEYLDLATRYAAAIDALYDAEGVASDRVTRVTAVRPHTIPVLNGSKDIIQIEVDMASETEETHDEMKKVFSDAVESDMIGEFPIAHHVNYTNI